ncbi:MAG: T9SS type A sorting domain-containing protein [Flavobacteriales bacterium]
MKHLLLFLALMCLFPALDWAQISRGGTPHNWEEKDLNRFDVEFESLENLDLNLIELQDAISDTEKDTPYRFGIEHDVAVTPATHGVWTELNSGDRIWRYGIDATAEATSVSFLFDSYSLEKGAKLFIWNADRTEFLGSFDHRNNKETGLLPVSLVHSNKVVVEYIVPNGISEGELSISMIVQGYRPILNKFDDPERGPYGNSGACNIDVNCPEGDEWQTEANSIALIISGGFASCSGAMVNNTANDGTPYFLTANHCLGNPSAWVYLFNHKAACGGNTPVDSDEQSISGGVLRASNGGSDFALVELSATPPADYNVQYSGWDRSDELSTGAVGIHHPSGDLMKICFEDDIAYQANQGGAAVWYIDEWELGVTEGGSSGSPLFDLNHRIIGQLYGGFAACSGSVNNGQADWYGRFGVSWDGSSSSNRLKDWLDPLGLNLIVLDGFPEGPTEFANDAFIYFSNELPEQLCSDIVYPEVTLLNNGAEALTSATIIVTLNGLVVQTIDWSGNLASDQMEVIGLLPQVVVTGSNTLTVEVSNVEDENSNNDESVLEFSAITGPTSLYTLEITLDDYGSETTWEVEENGIVFVSGGPYQDDLDGMVITETFCISDGCFDLTMNDSYGDGMCCDYGLGSYQLLNQFNFVEVNSDGTFTDSETNEFCANSLSVEDVTNLRQLELYPNPASTELNLVLPEENSMVMVYDISGRMVLNERHNSGTVTLDVSPFQIGSYLVVIETELNTYRSVFLKK